MDYFELMQRRLEGKEKGLPAWLGDKSATRPFARHIGVDVPKLHFKAKPSELPAKTFPTEFVIKPAFSSTSIGVKLLRKLAPGHYRDIINNKEIFVADLVAEYGDLSRKKFGDKNAGDVYVEELLRDRDGRIPPRDIRVYAFQGKIGFILAEDHISGIASASYYDENFRLLDDVENRFGVAEGAKNLEIIAQEPAPSNADEVLAVAKRISTSIPSPFCRIDLYNTSDSIKLGELTFYPGTFYYKNRKLMSPAEAIRLGRLWEEASDKLKGSVVK